MRERGADWMRRGALLWLALVLGAGVVMALGAASAGFAQWMNGLEPSTYRPLVAVYRLVNAVAVLTILVGSLVWLIGLLKGDPRGGRRPAA